jgi:hypothetical protein
MPRPQPAAARSSSCPTGRPSEKQAIDGVEGVFISILMGLQYVRRLAWLDFQHGSWR